MAMITTIDDYLCLFYVTKIKLTKNTTLGDTYLNAQMDVWI